MKPSRWISASGWRPLHTAAAWVPVLAGSRELTLWMTVVFMWAIVACYIVVLEQHARVLGRPQENNMNILALVAVYITFMPGTPFLT